MDNVNKLTAIAIAVAATIPVMANADVLISEYVEGSANNKAIELYNSGDSQVDLNGYKLVRYKEALFPKSRQHTKLPLLFTY